MGMIREILFRGKDSSTKLWLYGDLRQWAEKRKGICDYELKRTLEVIPETVGQYTGLTDKNGRKIFEGDILVFCKGATYPYKVIWDGIGWKLIRSDGKRIKEAFECNEIHYVKISEVIGNIHDNPELLGGGENEAD